MSLGIPRGNPFLCASRPARLDAPPGQCRRHTEQPAGELVVAGSPLAPSSRIQRKHGPEEDLTKLSLELNCRGPNFEFDFRLDGATAYRHDGQQVHLLTRLPRQLTLHRIHEGLQQLKECRRIFQRDQLGAEPGPQLDARRDVFLDPW
jgi:hypothetical protein